MLIIPLNYSASVVAYLTCRLHCQVLSLPITYLRVPLGANPRKEETWALIIDKIKKRLSERKSKLLSRARQLILIKSIVNSLPLYYLAILEC